MKIACQLCYDEAVRALTGPPKHRRHKTVLTHKHPEGTVASPVEWREVEETAPVYRPATTAPATETGHGGHQS